MAGDVRMAVWLFMAWCCQLVKEGCGHGLGDVILQVVEFGDAPWSGPELVQERKIAAGENFHSWTPGNTADGKQQVASKHSCACKCQE